MARRVVTVFGGSGFLGRHVVQRLAKTGAIVRVAVRDPEAAMFLKPMGDVGQIVLMKADVMDKKSVERAVKGADWVINLVGILYSSGCRTFHAIQNEGAKTVARAARKAGATKFVHVSALGAKANSPSYYADTKAGGEKGVLRSFKEATIFRPSVMFGPEDKFFNKFASLSRISWVLPVFSTDGFKFTRKKGELVYDCMGSGGPKFQPVYVGDVADAIMIALTKSGHEGKTYELVGPDVMSMRDVMEFIVKTTGRKRRIVPIPMWWARVWAAFLGLSPWPLLTLDQVRLLEQGSVASGKKPGLSDLGIEAETVESIVPLYLSRYRLMHRHTVIREA